MEWWQTTVVIAAGILTVFNLGDKIVAWAKAMRQPQDSLELRVEKLEKQAEFEYKALFAEYERRFKADLERINRIEETDNLIIKALLALIRNAETGNNKDKLKQVADEMQDFIISNK